MVDNNINFDANCFIFFQVIDFQTLEPLKISGENWQNREYGAEAVSHLRFQSQIVPPQRSLYEKI